MPIISIIVLILDVFATLTQINNREVKENGKKVLTGGGGGKVYNINIPNKSKREIMSMATNVDRFTPE